MKARIVMPAIRAQPPASQRPVIGTFARNGGLLDWAEEVLAMPERIPQRIRDVEAELAKTQRRIARGRWIVARQRERIGALKCDGYSSERAEKALTLFLMTLKAFEDYERLLWEYADEAVRACCETDALWFDPAADLRPDPSSAAEPTGNPLR